MRKLDRKTGFPVRISAMQCRMARAALGWSTSRLAQALGVNRKTIERLEGGTPLGARNDEILGRIFLRGGVQFLKGDGFVGVTIATDALPADQPGEAWASLELGNATYWVIVRRIYAEGALVEGEILPCEQAEVLFRDGIMPVRGRVAWVHANHAAIAFALPMSPEAAEAAGAGLGGGSMPGLSDAPLTERERRLIESWSWNRRRSRPEA